MAGTPVALGSQTLNGAGTFSFNTSAAVPAGGRVVVAMSYYKDLGTKTTLALTVGGNAMTLDKRTTNGNDFIEFWSYYSAAGLASAVAIVHTFSDTSGIGGRFAGAAYFTGGPSTGAVDTTAQATGTGASLSSGAATNTANPTDAVYFGAVGLEDATNPTTSTPTNGTEIHDLYLAAAGQGMWWAFQNVTSSASRAMTATASNGASTANTGALVIYSGSGGGSPAPRNLATLGVGT